MFVSLLSRADENLVFESVALLDGEALPDPKSREAIVITGSPFGVYDSTLWMDPLRDFVRQAFAAGTPMVGVCFGHQVIADAMGGDVRKSEKGWGIGRHVYDVAPGNGLIEGTRIALACSHQDQVTMPPAGARTGRSSPSPTASTCRASCTAASRGR